MTGTRLQQILRSPWFAPGLFLFAVLVRGIGIRWGLPTAENHWSLHPDEPIVWLYSQAVDLGKGDLLPGFYNYGTLYLIMSSVAAKLAGAYMGGSEPWQIVGNATLIARWMSVLAGASLVWMTYTYVARQGRATGAVIAAMGVALAPGMVVHSRFQSVDMVAAALGFGSLLAASMMLPSVHGKVWTHTKAAVVAGLLAGLSAGTKYTGITALIGLVVVLLFAELAWTCRIKSIAIAGLVALATFCFTTPGIFLEQEAFFRDLRYEWLHTQTGHEFVFGATSPGWLYHLANLVAVLGGPVLLLGVAGLGFGAWKKQPYVVAALAWALVTYLLIGRAEVKFLRYTLPMVAPLMVGLGALVSQWHAQGKTSGRIGVAAAMLSVAGLLGGGAVGAAQMTMWMAGPDSREQAAAILKAEATKGPVTVGLVSDPWFYSPTLYPMATAPRFVPVDQRDTAMREATNPAVVRYIAADGGRINWDVRLIDEVQPDFIVFSSFEADDLARIAADPAARPQFEAAVKDMERFRDRLQQDYEVWQRIGTGGPRIHDLMYIRPEVWIWRKKPKSATDSASTSNPSSTTSGTSGAPAPTP